MCTLENDDSLSYWEARKLIHKPYLSNSSSVCALLWLYLDVLLRHYWSSTEPCSYWVAIERQSFDAVVEYQFPFISAGLPDMWASIVRLNKNELNKHTYTHIAEQSLETLVQIALHMHRNIVSTAVLFSFRPSISTISTTADDESLGSLFLAVCRWRCWWCWWWCTRRSSLSK